MIVELYDIILRDMKAYNQIHIEEMYGNVVVPYPTTKPTYPYTVFDEIRNVVVADYRTPFDKLSSNGYRVDIFAKNKGTKQGLDKQTIARKIAKHLDNYLSNYVGLKQVSFNVLPSENDDSIYHITMMYEGTVHENRANFI